jgi:8-oxo-dGTP pyrophosphatase MutT (NUDIX family)
VLDWQRAPRREVVLEVDHEERVHGSYIGAITADRTDFERRLAELLLAPEEAVKLKATGGVAAAVLIPLYVEGGDLHAVFTKRNLDLRRHAGEISFPGGRRDEGEELHETALREAEEEIGLAPVDVGLVGALPPTGTFVTNYVIYPFVGLIEHGGVFRPNPIEVDAVVELSLPALVAGFERKRLVRRGVPIKTDTYTVDGNFIWGATARIVRTLLERLQPLL